MNDKTYDYREIARSEWVADPGVLIKTAVRLNRHTTIRAVMLDDAERAGGFLVYTEDSGQKTSQP